MKDYRRLILLLGFVGEVALALFPPMRTTVALEGPGIVTGATGHHFLLSASSGGWFIDTGRLAAYALLVASLTGMALVGEALLRGRK